MYIRKRKAEILRLDYPLVFWVYEGAEYEQHRSFKFDKEMFEVLTGSTAEEEEEEEEVIISAPVHT